MEESHYQDPTCVQNVSGKLYPQVQVWLKLHAKQYRVFPASVVYSLYVNFEFLSLEGQNSIWICVPDRKGQFHSFVFQLDCTFSPGNRCWDLRKPPIYWTDATTDKIKLMNSRKVLSL